MKIDFCKSTFLAVVAFGKDSLVDGLLLNLSDESCTVPKPSRQTRAFVRVASERIESFGCEIRSGGRKKSGGY